MTEFMGMPDTPENRKKFLADDPARPLLDAATTSRARALYLASDEANFVTGACLEVDGGRCV